MRRMLGVLVTAALCLSASPAWAEHLRVHELAESPQYGQKAGGMLGRGLLNVVTSFVDVLVNIVNETKSGPPLVGTLVGVAKGVGCGVLRAASGVVDVGTFWVPGFNGFPVSDSYANCLASIGQAAAMPGGEPAIQVYGSEMPSEPVQQVTQPSSEPVRKTWKK